MKIVKKLIAAAIALPVLAGLTACKDQFAEYSSPEAISGAQVYFSSENPAEIDGTMDGSTFEVYVSRAVTAGDITVPVKVTCENENVTLPTSVSFKDGQDVAIMTGTYNAANLEYNQEVPVTLEIGDASATTPYGLATYAFNFVIPMTWKTLGDATFYDAFMFNTSHKIKLQQCEQNPRTFRLVNPYGISADEEPGNYVAKDPQDYVEFSIYKAGETYDDQVLENDLAVYGRISTGYENESYDNAIIWALFPGEFTKFATADTWTHNTVLAWQDNGLPATVQFAPYYYMFGVGGWNKTQEDGYITITFPGVQIMDYDCAISYAGKFVNDKDETSIVANVTLGDDIESAQVALIPGTDPSATVNGLIDGSVEGTKVTASGEVRIPMTYTESGKYTLVVVAFDADGEAQAYDYSTFTYSAGGEAPESWTPAYVGTYVYSVYFGSEENPYNDEGLVLSVCDQDENKYKISHVFNDVEFVFTMNDDGTLDWEDQPIGDQYNGEDVYVTNLGNYEGFDPSAYSNGVFTFGNYYYISAGGWYGYEKYTLTAAYSEVKGMMKAPGKKNISAVAGAPRRMTRLEKNFMPMTSASLVK